MAHSKPKTTTKLSAKRKQASSGKTVRKFSENEVHKHLFNTGMKSVAVKSKALSNIGQAVGDNSDFELWRLIKRRALRKLSRLHERITNGEFIGSKIKLPIDRSKPMELDILGIHHDGIFVLELKVDRAAERNAFSELFAYSNYIAGMFALSGHKDITNVLVAKMAAKITKQAFLYDLLINDRDVIVYQPTFTSSKVSSLQLSIFVPSDNDFKAFVNTLISHVSMSCAVISFHDIPGWIDGEDEDGNLSAETKKNLSVLSQYTAQLMEADQLHGFCFIRKRWKEFSFYFENSLVICAVNPFRFPESTRATHILKQLRNKKFASKFFDIPESGFEARLSSIGLRALNDSMKENLEYELGYPIWSVMVQKDIETVYTHNLAFSPTGILREAYVSHISKLHRNADKPYAEDVSMLKGIDIQDWLRAWEFMETFNPPSDTDES